MPKSSVLIRKFLALAAEIHRREVTPLIVKTYEHALGDVPPKTLGPALLETLRFVTFWPTPGHIREKLEDLENQKPPRSSPKGCEDCRYTTWKFVTLTHPVTGKTSEAVTTCACIPRPSLFGSNGLLLESSGRH